MQLSCVSQNYAWGRIGRSSMVAKLTEHCVKIQDQIPYAELWMGTHCSGPSKVTKSSQLLGEYLNTNTKDVGYVPTSYAANDLPFLLKVLSVGTALSIQAHPDKVLAKELHSNFPTVYKDPNHKPEMAIALTQFEALCGFRSVTEILANCKKYPEFANILGDTGLTALNHIKEESVNPIQPVFEAYIHCPIDIIHTNLQLLQSRLELLTDISDLDRLILRLMKDYPNDIGIFAPLLLNYMQLQPGESFFMGANVPHAYLAGDCVECMALSDNVVRVGLTPKYKDVDTLTRMLVYSSTSVADCCITPIAIDEYTKLYRPPVSVCEEFELEVTQIASGTLQNTSYSIPNRSCASIMLVINGNCKVAYSEAASDAFVPELSLGSVIFLPAGVTMSISDCQENLILHRAHVNCALL